MEQPKSPVKIYHVGDKSGEDGRGVLTIATRVEPIKENMSALIVAFAFCSPKDTFSAKEGRKIAQERMENAETSYTICWSGNSAEDVKYFWNKNMPRVDKPTLWKNRLLVNVPQAKGLSFMDKSKGRPIRSNDQTANKVMVYVEGGLIQGAKATHPKAVRFSVFDADSYKEEGWPRDKIDEEWEIITRNAHPIF